MLIAIIILSFLLAAALIWLWLVKRDIRRSSRELDGITSSDTNARLTTGTFDRDISAFITSVNTLLERNRRVLFEKVRAEAELKQAISNISHDLRTPLTSALGYLQMLEGAEQDGGLRKRYLAVIKERLGALTALMNNLFDFAKLIEGNIPFDTQNVNASCILRDALSAGYPELTAKNFEVEAHIPDAPVFFYCDGNALLRVFQNLIKNVCAHGRDYLRVTLTENAVTFANKTDGLDALDVNRMFDRFYTADTARTGKNAGLGLAIVKELTERMGGKLEAEIEDGMLVIRICLRKEITAPTSK